MLEVRGVWIIDKEGDYIFNYERIPQSSGEIDSILFAQLISPVVKFTTNKSSEGFEVIKSETGKIISSVDKDKDIIIIFHLNKEADNKIVIKMISQIKQIINQYYPNTKLLVDNLDFQKLINLRNELEKQLNIKINEVISNFMEMIDNDI